MPDYAVYRLKITTLTPLHIGSGRELLNEYDYAIQAKRTWRINDAALLDAQEVDDPAVAQRLASVAPSQLLRETDFNPASPFFRYVIQGTPRAKGEGAVLREELKDTFDRAYLPGSSLKGSLRTALGWFAWEKLNLQLDPAQLDRRREWAARGYDKEIFGRDPNHDLMRALQVSDSAPVAADRLMVINVRVMNRGGALGSPIELEAIRPETEFETSLKLDLALFSDWARRHGLNLSGRDALLDLPSIVSRRSYERFQREAAWFTEMPGGQRLAGFFQQVLQQWPVGNRLLLQLGWGTGWDDKTFGTHMVSQDRRRLEGLISQYRLAKGRRNPGDPFPKSRRVVMLSSQDQSGRWQEVPVRPLGWLLVEFDPVRGGEEGWKAVKAASPAAPVIAKGPSTASAPASAPPTRITAPRPEPKPEPKPVASFNSLPVVGQRFYGVVLDVEPDGKVLLEIPGLSVDEAAMGVIPAAENPGGKRYKDGAELLVEVVRVKLESKNFAQVFCRLA